MPNSTARDIIAEFIRCCDVAASGGNADPYALLADNVSVMVNGTTPLSGHFPGLNIVKAVLVDTAKDRVKRANVSLVEFVGTGQRVAALLKLTAETVDGKIYNEKGDSCGSVFEVKDGKITEILFFPDTTLIETVLYNRRYVPNQ